MSQKRVVDVDNGTLDARGGISVRAYVSFEAVERLSLCEGFGAVLGLLKLRPKGT